MNLAHRDIVTGDRRRYVIDYREFLPFGDKLAAVLVTSSSTVSTIDTVLLSDDRTQVYFYVNAGLTFNEQFTAEIAVTDTNTQSINDTMYFTVIADTIISAAGSGGYVPGPTGPQGVAGSNGVPGVTGPTG